MLHRIERLATKIATTVLLLCAIACSKAKRDAETDFAPPKQVVPLVTENTKPKNVGLIPGLEGYWIVTGAVSTLQEANKLTTIRNVSKEERAQLRLEGVWVKNNSILIIVDGMKFDVNVEKISRSEDYDFGDKVHGIRAKYLVKCGVGGDHRFDIVIRHMKDSEECSVSLNLEKCSPKVKQVLNFLPKEHTSYQLSLQRLIKD